MVISRSDPPSSRRCDYMATASKPPPPHASSSPSSPHPHPSSTAQMTTTKRQPLPSPHQQQHQRRVQHNHHHQSSLHDFTFPVLKTWGRQRLLRCAKFPPESNEGTAAAVGGCAGGSVSGRGGIVSVDRRFAALVPPRTKVKDDGLEKIRAKLMGHLREAAGRMELTSRSTPATARRPDAPPPMEVEEDEQDVDDDDEEDEDEEENPDPLGRTSPAPAPSPPAVAPVPQPLATMTPPEEVKPWKLRTRRSTYNHARTSDLPRRRRDSSPSRTVSSPHRAFPSPADASVTAASPSHPFPVPVAPPPPFRSLRSRPSASPTLEDQDPASVEDEHQRAVQPRRPRQQPSRQPQKQRRRKLFSVTLSKEEIEEDVYALTGRRASRRPKKRPRAQKRQIDMLFPGYYLSEVTASLYDVREPARES